MPFVPDVTGPGLCVVVTGSELEDLEDVDTVDDGVASNMEEEEDDDGSLLLLLLLFCRPTPTPTPIPTPRLTTIRMVIAAKAGKRSPQIRLLSTGFLVAPASVTGRSSLCWGSTDSGAWSCCFCYGVTSGPKLFCNVLSVAITAYKIVPACKHRACDNIFRP
jgi:hypothetical protein